MTDSPNKAVFLSYASQDAGAARRIAEALRASGVEAWFDQNELVGGDAWDAKIRKQIAECALFIPVISANTQARREGYFRLEWKLAAQRTHMIADGTPFLLPVVIDNTRDGEALVPAEFRPVQWTRLQRGENAGEFAARVATLTGDGKPATPPSDAAPRSASPSARTRSPLRRFAGVAFVLLLAAGGIAWSWFRSASPEKPAAIAPAASAPALSEARRLVAQARAMQGPRDWESRDALSAIEPLLKRAVELDPGEAEAWAAYSQLSTTLIMLRYDDSPARYEQARQQAEVALRLKPDSIEAQFAVALTYYHDAYPEAEQRLQAVVARAPNDARAWRWLGNTLRRLRRVDEAAAAYERADRVTPGGDAWAQWELAQLYHSLARFDDMERCLDRSIALLPIGRVIAMKALWLAHGRGDFPAANAMLERMPSAFQRDDRGAYVAASIALTERDPQKCLRALARVPREFFEDNAFTGPKAFLTGLAHDLAGRRAAAEADWRAALVLIDARLKQTPRDPGLLLWRARLLACVGEKAEAARVFDVYRETARGGSGRGATHHGLFHFRALLGDIPGAVDAARRSLTMRAVVFNSPTVLRLNPLFDSVRETPEFQALLAEAETIWRSNPPEVPR